MNPYPSYKESGIKWIEEIPVGNLRFFEPGCGHAPFLVSLMRMLRTLTQLRQLST